MTTSVVWTSFLGFIVDLKEDKSAKDIQPTRNGAVKYAVAMNSCLIALCCR